LGNERRHKLNRKRHMFDLEEAIAAWRRKMSGAGVKSPAPLDELELHLREQLQRAESIDQKAFDIAVRELGNPISIRTEFKKVERQSMKRKIIIGVAILAFLFGTGIILPALGQHKQRNLAALEAGENYFAIHWRPDEVVPLCIGLVITLGAVAAGVKAVKASSKTRMA
jgi:hypothetical protein